MELLVACISLPSLYKPTHAGPRYGAAAIRGHGIPEAIEAILMNGSRVEPKVAFLKPVSSAIAIVAAVRR